MRTSFLASLALTACLLAAPAFAGDVTIENSTVNATAKNQVGRQTATAEGKYSIAQAGTASIESAGGATVTVTKSNVDLTGNIAQGGTNEAYATGAYSIAQAGVASIQGASGCNCSTSQ